MARSRVGDDDRIPILVEEDHGGDPTEEGTIPEHNETGLHCASDDTRGPNITHKLPWGAILLDKIGLFNWHTRKSLQLYILVLTFMVYAAYHMSRKPFSVVANVLAPNCTVFGDKDENKTLYSGYLVGNVSEERPGWPPFNGPNCKTLIGAVDYAWLFTYAVFLVCSGLIADRVNLRYFLTFGMFGSGVFVGLLGVAYYGNVHHISYFLVIQIFVGVFESTGWPGIIAVMGNWFGKKRRGLLMGIWNAHTSVGNILGTAIPAIWAVKNSPWGWSFIVPGFTMIGMGIIVYFFLITDPAHMGLSPPKHHLDTEEDEQEQQRQGNGSPSTPTRYRSISDGAPDPTTSPVTAKRKMNLDDNYQTEDEEGIALVTSASEFEDTALVASDNRERRKRRNSIGYTEKNANDLLSNSKRQEKREQDQSSSSQSPLRKEEKKKAISLIGALKIPGVIEYSLALFFAKLVAYTFLFWLPYYIHFHPINGVDVHELHADLLATLYDVGGIFGGITTGAVSDLLDSRAISCVIMMYLAVPTLFLYRYLGHDAIGLTVVLIMLCGFCINGPYAIITTAVSNDLGTHKDLKDNTKAKATVGAIIDGTGSLGAAFGPLITGWVSDDFGWDHAFYVLMVSCFLSSLMLSRLVFTEVLYLCRKFKKWQLHRRNPSYAGRQQLTRAQSESTL